MRGVDDSPYHNGRSRKNRLVVMSLQIQESYNKNIINTVKISVLWRVWVWGTWSRLLEILFHFKQIIAGLKMNWDAGSKRIMRETVLLAYTVYVKISLFSDQFDLALVALRVVFQDSYLMNPRFDFGRESRPRFCFDSNFLFKLKLKSPLFIFTYLIFFKAIRYISILTFSPPQRTANSSKHEVSWISSFVREQHYGFPGSMT